MRRLAAVALILLLPSCALLHRGTPAAEGQKYVIFFQPFSANLDEQAQAAVKAAAASAVANAGVPVTVAGFASPIGSVQANADLARTRAQVVADGLVTGGVTAARIKRKALGETDYTLDPIESRRVDISVGRRVMDAALAARSARASPGSVLAAVFGFPSFRPLQDAAVRHVTEGGDALVLMPTGGGKSVCYQVPALCRPGVGLVISPLIALMEDQVAALRQLGVAAAALHSERPPDDQRQTARDLDAGQLDLLYVSPERLLAGSLIERLQGRKIALIAIDEAHCVSQWGHEFRPEYRALACLRERFAGVPRVALTATADPRTRADILAALDMPEAAVFVASFHRQNLDITVAPKESETAQVLALIRRRPGQTGIIYCGSRAKTERVAASLAAKGVPAIGYHAKLDAEVKRAALTTFRSGEAMVMVATIAFGMGIDRPDVRFVAHLDMPDSPEAYYQQIGRAGRDGAESETLLLYGGEDIARARHFLQISAAPEAQKAVMRTRLEAMIALTETTECRTRVLLSCFGETLSAPCGHCDNCRRPAKVFDGSLEARKLLSAIYRTGERFGAKHVISVLRGEATDTAVARGHDKLPVFGIGADRPPEFWRGAVRHLVARGALAVEDGVYATLSLVPEVARPILRGEEPVLLRDDPPPAPRAARVRDAAAPVVAGIGGAVFDALRAWRLREAKAQGVPPYVIFHDSVLRDIAEERPASLAALGRIKGVGASKLERYGGAVLAAMTA